MPRKPRSYMEASFFHIVVQGIEKNYIFDTKEDIEKYIQLFTKETEGILIFAYCVMNNHAHILIKVQNIEYMKKWMHKVNTSYANYYNKKYKRVGYVFKNRYYSQEIQNIKHLYRCIQYIHDNPVKANLCKNADDYKYSSFQSVYKSNFANISNFVSHELQQEMPVVQEQSVFEKYAFIFEEYDQTKEEVCEQFLKDVQDEYKMTMKNLRKDRSILIEILKILKKNLHLSNEKIGEEIGISRETVRTIIKENSSRW